MDRASKECIYMVGRRKIECNKLGITGKNIANVTYNLSNCTSVKINFLNYIYMWVLYKAMRLTTSLFSNQICKANKKKVGVAKKKQGNNGP